MKKLFLFLFLCGLLGFSSGKAFAQCDKNRSTPIQCGYYDEGFQDGATDAQNNASNDYRRRREKIDGRRYETFYRDGYDAGFNSIKPFSRWSPAQRNNYDTGFRFGDSDRRRSISRLPARYEGQYERTSELYYEQGYQDGFDSKSKLYDVPLGGTAPTVPTNPPPTTTPGGTVSGSVSWSGRVDNRVNVIIQGADVRSEDLTQSGLQVGYQIMNGVLPRRSANLTVNKLQGRGVASVIQQPIRENGFVGIIQISDSRSGADDYRLDISWNAPNTEEPYQAGRVNWRGSVDQTANITIAGGDVQTQTITGNPVARMNFNISGTLARRGGTISALKKRGRGTVTILQQPTAENNYTAIVQVLDPGRSSDNYEIEISW